MAEVNDVLGRMERCRHYLKRGKELIKSGQSNNQEFMALVGAIKEESEWLSPEQRNLVLEEFFNLWDRKN